LLDNLRSTWNVGSILRTADGAGMNDVYLCGITPPADHPRVIRTSLGAETRLHWSWHPNALDLVSSLLETGSQLWALETTPEAVAITSAPRIGEEERVVLVVGNEITGIDPDLLLHCSRTFWIPMAGVKRSLNTAVAFGIAAYFLTLPSEYPRGS
jgi:23S rRNA (guanosine2251-2'-O)-methyltransferase